MLFAIVRTWIKSKLFQCTFIVTILLWNSGVFKTKKTGASICLLTRLEGLRIACQEDKQR